MTQEALFVFEQQELTSNDYYTPKWIFDTLGLIFDLDVAAPPGGIEHIPALAYYTQKNDGLAQDWFGRVWMNPPFSKPQPWVHKFMEHGNGVAMLPVSKSYWFMELWNSETAITYMPSNLKFVDPKGGNGSIFMPCVMVAIGNENIEAMSKIGKIR